MRLSERKEFNTILRSHLSSSLSIYLHKEKHMIYNHVIKMWAYVLNNTTALKIILCKNIAMTHQFLAVPTKNEMYMLGEREREREREREGKTCQEWTSRFCTFSNKISVDVTEQKNKNKKSEKQKNSLSVASNKQNVVDSGSHDKPPSESLLTCPNDVRLTSNLRQNHRAVDVVSKWRQVSFVKSPLGVLSFVQ